MNTTEIISNHLARAGWNKLDARDVDRAKVRILDAIGNIAAGVRSSGQREFASLITNWGGRPDATVIGQGVRIPAVHAAMLNAAAMRSFDFEPVGAENENAGQVAAHISGTTIPVAVAVAERLGSTGRELLTALVLGDDITARLAAASGFDVYGGQDNTGTVNVLGATAVAAKLIHLDERRIRHALGIAANQFSGTIDSVNDKTLAFKLPIALSARNAIFSAELAATGFTGPRDAITGRFGYLSLYGNNPEPKKITRELGQRFYADAVIKPWSCCRASHPSLDAALTIRSRHAVRPETIERVLVHVTSRTKQGFVGQPFEVGESPEVSAAFSIRYTTAVGLLYGTVRPEHLTIERISDPLVTEMIARIELIDSLPPNETLTAEVEILLRSGERYRHRTDAPKGDIHHNPMSAEDVAEKFFANVDFGGSIAVEQARDIAAMIAELERIDDVGSLTKLLTG